jgi:hypothetical protein
MMGSSPSGLFGYTHMMGGYAGTGSICPCAVCRCRSAQNS